MTEICDDCQQHVKGIREVEIHGFKYNLCRSCEIERDFNDEIDGVE